MIYSVLQNKPIPDKHPITMLALNNAHDIGMIENVMKQDKEYKRTNIPTPKASPTIMLNIKSVNMYLLM